MRYALLSDVHANLQALQTVVRQARRLGVDGYLCAGDLVGYGAQPNECVEELAGLGAVCVAGNHDLAALGQLTEPRAAPVALDTMRWTREVLRADAVGYLSALPQVAAADGVLVTHGALGDPEEYVRSQQRARDQLDAAPTHAPDARVVVLGHTHAPWVFTRAEGTVLAKRTGSRPLPRAGAGALTLVNPGSVGQSRARSDDARFAVLDLGRGTVTLHAVSYDTRACRRALAAAGRPVRSYHLVDPWPKRLRHRAAGVRRRVRALTG